MIRRDTDIDAALHSRARQRALIEGRGPRVSEFLLNPHRFGSGGGATDPYFSQRALGLHCDGSNGGTTFTDNSPTPKTVTPTLSTTSTAQAKFGVSSCSFATSGASVKLTIPHSADLAPTGDFTVDFFVRLGAAVSQRILIYKSISSGHTPYGLRLTTANRIQLFVSNAAGSAFAINMTGTTALNTSGVWQHIALTRSGSNYYLFIDGVVELTGSYAGAGYVNASHPVVIGNTTDDLYPINGGANPNYMDDIRIYNGVALWTANFTPPTSPFPNS